MTLGVCVAGKRVSSSPSPGSLPILKKEESGHRCRSVVRVIYGSDLDAEGSTEVSALTLGEALEGLDLDLGEVRVFVDGVDAARLEGPATPVGDEDTLLVTRW